MDSNQKLSIIVPTFNEEKTILEVLEKIQKIRPLISNLTLIVVNDGSSDETSNILLRNPALYDILITCERNSGKGKAVILGLGKVDTGYVLIQDADLEYCPSQIPRLWNLAVSHEVDLLATSRMVGAEVTRVHYFWHKIGNRVITLFFNIINNTTFTDIYSGYLIFDRNTVSVSKLNFNKWGQQAELLTFIIRESERIYEAPISYFGRKYSEGKKIRAINIFGVLLATVITKFRVLK